MLSSNVGWKHPGACRSELDREQEAIEPSADLLDIGHAPDVGLHRLGALDEELDRILLRQRCNRVLVLAGQVERRAAGREHAQVGSGGEQHGDKRRCLKEVLEVVEDEQQLARAKPIGDRRLVRESSSVVRDHRADEPGLLNGRECDEYCGGHGLGDRKRQACLADSARPDQRDEPGTRDGPTWRRT